MCILASRVYRGTIPITMMDSHAGPLVPIFWGEISPSEHMVQFYEHDGVLLDTLAGFVSGGLKLVKARLLSRPACICEPWMID
jgi:hypothetical protein